MRKATFLFVFYVLAIGVSTGFAEEFGTLEEAKKLAENAAEYFTKNGLDDLARKVNSKDPQFAHKDLYVFINSLQGKNIAHGADSKFHGGNFLDLRDISGVYIIRMMIRVARDKGRGWIDYKWLNPATGKIRSKSSYIIRIGDNHFLGVGAYRN